MSRLVNGPVTATTVGSRSTEGAGGPDRLADRLLGAPMSVGIALVCLAALATWLPGYLLWPFWTDLDMSATSALSWDRGLLPYRDVMSINFPGQVYLFWLLGKIFGWGRTVPFYALDATILVALGVLMAAWSRRRGGSSLPGLAGYLCFVVYYLGLGFDLVAQRDWQSCVFAVCGLLILQTWPGRGGRWLGALSFAASASFRPSMVLFLPAALFEVASGAWETAGRRGAVRAVLEWSVAFAALTVLLFAPLILNGLVDDFVRGIALTGPAGPYAKRTPRGRLADLERGFTDLKTVAVPVSILLLRRRVDARLARGALTWLMALLASLLYGPIAPRFHFYHAVPIMLVLSVNVAVLVQMVLRSTGYRPTVRLAIVALMLGVFIPGRPAYCSPKWSLKVARAIARGERLPTEAPPGIDVGKPWGDYQQTIVYLKNRTAPGTRVANLMNPYCLSLNSMSGRLSVFRIEVPTTIWVEQNLVTEADLIRFLEETPDSVVVWDPDDPPRIPDPGSTPGTGKFIVLRELPRATGRLYEPEARFGRFEVWRRKRTPPLKACVTIGRRTLLS